MLIMKLSLFFLGHGTYTGFILFALCCKGEFGHCSVGLNDSRKDVLLFPIYLCDMNGFCEFSEMNIFLSSRIKAIAVKI